MLWMSRPPYLRWFAAGVVLATAFAIELRPTTTVRMPVAAADLPAGSTVEESDVHWVDVSEGVFEPVPLPTVLSRDVHAGSPITSSDISAALVEIPADWLRIELEVPASTRSGATVVAVMTTSASGQAVTGVVAEAPAQSDFEGLTAMIAFPPADAVAVAVGLAEGTVTVLLGA